MPRSDDNNIMLFSYRDAHFEKKKDAWVKPYKDPLAREISKGLITRVQRYNRQDFANGEVCPTVMANVQGRDTYALFRQDPKKSINDDFMSYIILLDALNTAEAKTITAVIPNLPYSRQDQANGKRQSITARLVADLLRTSGIDRVITIGLHADQIEGFYRGGIRIRPLRTDSISSHYLQRSETVTRLASIVKADVQEAVSNPLDFFRKYVTAVMPDGGALRRTNRLRRRMDPAGLIELGLVPKERTGTNEAETGQAQGIYEGRIALITEDILDTAGTLFNAASALKKSGAVHVMAYVDHVLGNSKPGDASFEKRFTASDLDELIGTNSVSGFHERVLADSEFAKRTTVLSIAPLLTQTIIRSQRGDSIREMVDDVEADELYSILHERSG
jgi:ribose-phosphate pyrophosphokinase